MCVVSMVGEFYGDKWKRRWPNTWPYIPPYVPTPPIVPIPVVPDGISKEEFEELKKEVLDMKELLKKAVKYDEENGEPDCHMDEKVAALKKVAELVGVDLSDVLK